MLGYIMRATWPDETKNFKILCKWTFVTHSPHSHWGWSRREDSLHPVIRGTSFLLYFSLPLLAHGFKVILVSSIWKKKVSIFQGDFRASIYNLYPHSNVQNSVTGLPDSLEVQTVLIFCTTRGKSKWFGDSTILSLSD